MRDYLTLGQKILRDGYDHPDRTRIGRRSLFSESLRFNLAEGFPLVSTRHINFDAVVHELLWFIAGNNDIRALKNNGVNFWNHWAVTDQDIDSFIDGYIMPFFNHELDRTLFDTSCKRMLTDRLATIGMLYGPVWRRLPVTDSTFRLGAFLPKITEAVIATDHRAEWANDYKKHQEAPDPLSYLDYLNERARQEIDQLQALVIGLKQRPWSSRHVISSWIPEYIPIETIAPAHNVLLGRGALAPCHVYQQYLVSPGVTDDAPLRLSLHLTQRSSDVPIGLPVNIAQYALLLSIIAQCVDMVPYEFHWCGVDVHVYENQRSLFAEQLTRTPYPKPRLYLNPAKKDILQFTAADIRLDGYQSHPSITYPIAI
jgi:thymidylate synthase